MNEPRKIVLLQLMSNGDCLYATAVAHQIKHDHPGCHLTWVIAAFCRRILDNNPFVDEVIEIPDVSKANVTPIIQQLRKDLNKQKAEGKYDEIIFTQIVDENQANYDGTVRSAIFRGYPGKVTVPITPVLRLSDAEIKQAETFAAKYRLTSFKNVILFEFAPQSGQVKLTPEMAIRIAETLTHNENTAIILSSAIKIGDANPQIIDGSQLTLRETAHISHYCNLLLGCSSGITWITTSEAGKLLPMIQILDANAFWVNPISRDFERQGIPRNDLIELYSVEEDRIIDCVSLALRDGFQVAKAKYYTPLPLQFKTTSRSIYNMLCFLQLGAIIKHIRINISVFGPHPLLLAAIANGFITAPFKLVSNIYNKRIRKH